MFLVKVSLGTFSSLWGSGGGEEVLPRLFTFEIGGPSINLPPPHLLLTQSSTFHCKDTNASSFFPHEGSCAKEGTGNESSFLPDLKKSLGALLGPLASLA